MTFKRHKCLALAIAYTVVMLCVAQKNKKGQKLTGTGSCPSTCTLKRRIGKVETRLRREISEATAQCSNGVETFRRKVNMTTGLRSSDENGCRPSGNLTSNILEVVSEKLTAATKRMHVEISNRYNVMNASMWKVLQEQETNSNRNHGAPGTEHHVDRIRAMNGTIRALQDQNGILTRLSQEMRAQNAVLRARSDIVDEDLERFRQLNQKQQAMAADQDRIIDIEEKVSEHATQLSSLRSKLEWLTTRVEQLSNNVDAAKAESSSASDKAIRAAEAARKAIAIARQRTPPAEDLDADAKNDRSRQPAEPPNDCWELYQMGYNVSGIYRIRPRLSSRSFNVYCEQSYGGGGWTVIQRRRDGSVDFDRDWNAYADGFGSPDGEMWLGNEKIYHLTNQDDYALQVLLLDWEGNRAFAEYDTFRIHGNPDNYAIEFGSYTRGNAGDGLRGTSRDGSRNAYLAHFTTANIDNDLCQPCIANSRGTSFYNCAELQGGGWWFRACSDSNLNGRYILPQNFSSCDEVCQGIQWRTWKDEPAYSLKASIMLLRRNERRNDV